MLFGRLHVGIRADDCVEDGLAVCLNRGLRWLQLNVEAHTLMRRSRLALLLGARFLISCAHNLNEAESPLLGAGVHLVRLVTVCRR